MVREERRRCALEHPLGGVWIAFDSREDMFEELGLNIRVLAPGQPASLYHAESAQEDFLVLAGECLAIVEDREQALHAWDFLHFPADTEHILVGAGEGPCAVLMVGGRPDGKTLRYPVSELAARHGASVEQETTDPREAYAAWGQGLRAGARRLAAPLSDARASESTPHGRDTQMTDRAIDMYLNDHFAGAMLGSDLARQIRDQSEGTPLGEVMGPIATMVEEDRETLRGLMESMNVSKNPIKQATGWVAEKASRAKFSGTMSGEGDLGAFMALETLTLGVEGKASMWRVLKEVQGHFPPLASTDLDELISRAEVQHDTLERERVAAGRRSLGN